MKRIFCCILLLYIAPSLWSQNLVREKRHYSLEGNPLSLKEVRDHYKSVPQALKQFKKAQLQFGVSSSLLLLGGAYTGGNIGYFTATGELEWKQAGIGVGVLVLGLVATIGVEKKYDRAVQMYNQHKGKKSSFQLKINKEGVGVRLTF